MRAITASNDNTTIAATVPCLLDPLPPEVPPFCDWLTSVGSLSSQLGASSGQAQNIISFEPSLALGRQILGSGHGLVLVLQTLVAFGCLRWWWTCMSIGECNPCTTVSIVFPPTASCVFLPNLDAWWMDSVSQSVQNTESCRKTPQNVNILVVRKLRCGFEAISRFNLS